MRQRTPEAPAQIIIRERERDLARMFARPQLDEVRRGSCRRRAAPAAWSARICSVRPVFPALPPAAGAHAS